MSSRISARWRAPESYRSVIEGGRPALAWELLRRDPLYCEDWQLRPGEHAVVSPGDVGAEARWGVHFRA